MTPRIGVTAVWHRQSAAEHDGWVKRIPVKWQSHGYKPETPNAQDSCVFRRRRMSISIEGLSYKIVDRCMMTSQFEASIPSLVQIEDAVTAGYAASLYIAEQDKGPHGKRLTVLEVDPDYRVECVLNLQNFGFQEQTMEAMYTVSIEGNPLMVDLGEIGSDTQLRKLLSCLEARDDSC